ncbi:MAG: hypothetical protein GKC53_04725 [Neisseriaceae bacterium]|nr:MAG: hypothetical protein GKC53_04725 [Neisseriaceae bacterium]
MSSFTDRLLRFMGYMIIFIMIIVVCIVIYLVYTLMFSSDFKQQSNTPNTRVLMDQNINSDLNEKNQSDHENTSLSNDPMTTNIPQYIPPESQIPSYSTYNPFEDDNIPITEPDNNTTSSNPIGEISSQPDNSSAKPLDPTNKSQQPDLNLLF